eukprot:CAMPEP_0204566488 /NCGR_PEP_ID=MMETSP0661-20131031/36080_1 /ASSEMBLY_ACC=CAM_ASM_000606 /TAXON_ID=109239 /ORGANISM="Alexandrium margalefi, Strain AMGDE01CS-322" /LENGTH=34 /DNA_ID= /DNA_START= /DNA_END= /DNA_ORIENTATION=
MDRAAKLCKGDRKLMLAKEHGIPLAAATAPVADR